MFLDGRLHEAPRRIAVTHPHDGGVVGEVSADSAGDVRHAVAAVRDCADRLAPDRRAEVLRRAADLLLERSGEFATRSSRESGVCLKETRREVTRAAVNLTVAAEEATRVRGETHDIVVGGRRRWAFTVPEPVGVIAAITPFNRPLNQVVVKLAPAIAAGARVVLKPSEKTPLTALAFAGLLVEAGLPPGLLAVVTGRPEELGPALAGDPAIDMVTFTGGQEAGQAVAARAAGKKTVLELGGNDPLIVLADADLHLAARLAATGAFGTAGQSCRGVKRVLVAEPVADEFAGLLVRAAKGLRCGDPLDPETDVGPLISAAAADVVEKRCLDAVSGGARVLHGGERDGALITPAVLDHVPADAELVRRETMGPVAPIIRVRDAGEALAVANSTSYGLQAGVVTKDAERFLALARELRVGAVNLNEGPQFDSPHIPFGGVKGSGVGREGIRYSIREMVTVKTVTVPAE